MSEHAAIDDVSASSIDASAMLERFQAAGVFETGKVNLISVAAVREAFGKRWELRKSMVWDVAETYIRRYIGETGHMARLDEQSFLVITPTLDSLVSRIQAVRSLREILTHFLGELRPQDLVVQTASEFRDGQLSCRTLTTEEVDEAIRREIEADRAETAAPSHQMVKITAPEEREIHTLEGRRLRFSVSVDPLIDLAKGAITAHRIEPKITYEDTRERMPPEARRRLMPADIQDVDIVTMQRALHRLEAGESAIDRPSVLVSVSFLTITNARSRARFLGAIAHARDLIAKSVIFEMTDFDAGVPKSRLQEAATFLRPFCRAVFASDQVGTTLVKEARATGIVGLVYETPSVLTSPDDIAVWLFNAGRATAAHAGPRLVVNLPAVQLAAPAAAAGFTHAALRPRAARAADPVSTSA